MAILSTTRQAICLIASGISFLFSDLYEGTKGTGLKIMFVLDLLNSIIHCDVSLRTLFHLYPIRDILFWDANLMMPQPSMAFKMINLHLYPIMRIWCTSKHCTWHSQHKWSTSMMSGNGALEEFICKNRQTPSQNWAFSPPCILYYLVFNIKIFFGQTRQSSICFPAKLTLFCKKPINATFAGWHIQINHQDGACRFLQMNSSLAYKLPIFSVWPRCRPD